jgi:putative radical SAM enzyme (TIGR03279 family)
MTTEPAPEVRQGGLVTGVASGSLGETLGVQTGDLLTAVNGQPVADVIDVQFYAAEEQVELTFLRAGQELVLSGQRSYNQEIGLEFEHPTFDIDIRRCNNLCEFCFVLQMPATMRRTLYIKDDDYRYSFLFGHYVTLTNLADHDWWRIANQGLSPLYISVHATDLELRRRFLRNDAAPDIMQQLGWLIDNGVTVHTQLVVVPGLNDGAHLEKSVRDLASLYPGVHSVSVVPVGLTRHHKYGMRVHTVEEAEKILERCHTWQDEYKAQLGVHLVYPTDEWYLVTKRPIPPRARYDNMSLEENGLGLVRRFLEEWEQSLPEVEGHALFWDLESMPVKSLTLATATLFAETLKTHAGDFADTTGVPTEVVPITNTRLGETITVAGLLMGDDVITQLSGRELGEVVVLPRVMFDHPNGVSLDDVSPLDIAKALGKQVALVDLMGDVVDVLHGQAALLFDPVQGALISPDAIQRSGGWAVEKYL